MPEELDLVVSAARLRTGEVVDIGVVGERVAAIADRGLLRAGRVVPAQGRLATETFVNAHMHLDKVYTLPMAGDGALAAYAGGSMGSAMSGIELARVVKEHYHRSWIEVNATRALEEAVRHGTLHVLAFVDVDTTAGLEGLYGVLAARRRLGDVVDVQVVAFPQDGVVRDPGAAAVVEEAMLQGADVVGGIPWIEHCEADAARHVEWACALAVRLGRRVAMLVDDAGDPALRTTELLATAVLEHGLHGRAVACPARAVGTYAEPSQRRLAGLALRAGLGFVSDPHTGPLHLPVDLFDQLGVPVALGQDDIEDAYYPFGRHNMLEVAFLAAHLLGFLSSADQLRLLDFVTTKAARVLGVPGHEIAVGNVANIAVHDAERVVDVLRAHAAPRWVIGAGRVVAETTVTSTVSRPQP